MFYLGYFLIFIWNVCKLQGHILEYSHNHTINWTQPRTCKRKKTTMIRKKIKVENGKCYQDVPSAHFLIIIAFHFDCFASMALNLICCTTIKYSSNTLFFTIVIVSHLEHQSQVDQFEKGPKTWRLKEKMHFSNFIKHVNLFVYENISGNIIFIETI